MVNYELTYIIKPDVEEEPRKALVERFSGLIEGSGGTVAKIDDWGKKQLAYEIEDYTEGHYIYLEFSCDPDYPKELERNLKINEDIIRYMIIKVDK